MAEPEEYLPNNSGWRTEESQRPLKWQQTLQQQSHKFQALRDWNWFQSAPTSPWGFNPMCPVSSYGGTDYVQQRCSGRFYGAACTEANMSAVHMSSEADSRCVFFWLLEEHKSICAACLLPVRGIVRLLHWPYFPNISLL